MELEVSRSGVAVTPDGKFAYVTNSFSNTVSVINVATNLVVGGTDCQVGDFSAARGVAITPDGKFVYVANTATNGFGTVSVINVATNLVVGAPIAVGDGTGPSWRCNNSKMASLPT